MHSFRAFAQGKATWILNYSWDGDKKVDKREAMKNLAMSQVMAGANFWDAPGHSMAGSNDLGDAQEDLFVDSGSTRKRFTCRERRSIPLASTFRRKRGIIYAKDFIASYRGILILLMQKHLEFQIVTPRTLGEFQGTTLVLPDVRVLSDSEEEFAAGFRRAGGRVVITGTDATGIAESENVVRFADIPGQAYGAASEKDFDIRLPGLAAGISGEPGGRRCGADQGWNQVATSIARTIGRSRQCFLRELCWTARGIESGTDAADGVEGERSFAKRGRWVLSAVSWGAADDSGRAPGRQDHLTPYRRLQRGRCSGIEPAEKALNRLSDTESHRAFTDH